MKIFLIGLSGTGKSSLGKQLSKKLNAFFLDSDSIIEENENESISEIFKLKGEQHFRKLENHFIVELSEKYEQEKDIVISTGGGLPCFNNNIDKMLEQGIVVHLTMPIEMLASRLEGSKDRPLLKGHLKEKLKTLLNERISVYSQAHLTIESANWNSKKMINLVEKLHQVDSISNT